MKLLDTSVGFLLARTARSMKRALETRLSEHNITATQYVVLALLGEEDGISLSKLGHRLYFDNPTITGIVDRMERDGLVERRRIADDRRVINIFVTPKGQELLKKSHCVADDLNNQSLDGLSENERDAFLDALNVIWKKMNGKNG